MGHPLVIPLVAVTLFAAVARGVRAVDWGGALAGWAVALVLYLSAGLGGFLGLVGVFLCAWLTTMFGRSRKQLLGLAEKKKGRSATQIVANLLAAAVCGLLALRIGPAHLWYVAAFAALAEAAADTTSSEIGMASGRQPRLITTLEPVAIGTDGGITSVGTAAALPAALFIALIAWETGVIHRHDIVPVLAAGVAGMLLDSLYGATFERRRWLNNDAVNLLGTASAAALALLFERI
jgi:uncharacterized protein (TIGR00297 family)